MTSRLYFLGVWSELVWVVYVHFTHFLRYKSQGKKNVKMLKATCTSGKGRLCASCLPVSSLLFVNSNLKSSKKGTNTKDKVTELKGVHFPETVKTKKPANKYRKKIYFINKIYLL